MLADVATRPWAAAVATIAALSASGCTIDARTLHLAGPRPHAGFYLLEPDAAVSDATTPVDGSSTDAGTAADSSSCLPNLQGGTVCGDDIVENGGFAVAVAPWAADTSVTIDFSSDDATATTGSGSAAVRNASAGTGAGWSFAAASECLPARAHATYALAALAFIAGGQGSGGAGLGVTFYDGLDCAGTELRSDEAPPTDKTDHWISVETSVLAPDAARSLLVRLIVEKPLGNAAFAANFDDVQVVRDERTARRGD